MFHILLTLESTHVDNTRLEFYIHRNMMQWWNNATIKHFRDRAQCMIEQYSKYRIDEVGLHVNGRMTQGLLFCLVLDAVRVLSCDKFVTQN